MQEVDCTAHYQAKARVGLSTSRQHISIHKRSICKAFTTQSNAAGRRTLRIATRPSKLALRQSEQVAELLKSWSGLSLGPNGGSSSAGTVHVELVPQSTRGDMPADGKGVPLLSMRDLGPGAFTADLDLAVQLGMADLAVHSLKDAPPIPPRGLVLGGCLPREDPHDCLLSLNLNAQRIRDIPAGTIIGTSSTRRRALLLASNPGLRVEPMRGNVDARLEQLAAGHMDGTVLGLSGLRRLGRTDVTYTLLPYEDMLPAACSGIVGVMVREDDVQLRHMLQHLGDCTALLEATAERSLLAQLMSQQGQDNHQGEQMVDQEQELRMPQHAVAALARCSWADDGRSEGGRPPAGDMVMEAVVADVEGAWVRRVGGGVTGVSCHPDKWHDSLEAVRRLGADLGQQLRFLSDQD